MQDERSRWKALIKSQKCFSVAYAGKYDTNTQKNSPTQRPDLNVFIAENNWVSWIGQIRSFAP